jgi:DNA-binding LytR/AlgR family response regulator
MNILIIEDEKPAADKLEIMLKKYDDSINIKNKIDCVIESVKWLSNPENKVDLILMDIQLTDGISFDIFNHVKVTTPIIFTTAYNEYAIEAFKVNSIDYLLKPISYEDLCTSIDKFKNLREFVAGPKEAMKFEDLGNLISQFQKSYKSRFMIKVGEHIKSITTDNIVLFYAEGRNVSVYTPKGRQYIIDYRLESLENMLDPKIFFRINRSFIVNINSITDVIVYSNSRLKIKVDPEFEKEIIVSREKVNDFKIWFAGD